MNYRHAFHAGNFADVVKHATLARIIAYLKEKPAAFRVIDTHAGAGLYDLSGPEASRTGEWRDGIGKLAAAAFAPPVRDLLAPYLDAVASFNRSGALRVYPGSPALVRSWLRPQDRMVVCEREPNAAHALAGCMQGDRRIKVVAIDGYMALNAYVPPPERRGVVLIDPPFEATDELVRLSQALSGAHRKWPTGVYLLWYPIKDARATASFARRLAGLAIARVLRVEFSLPSRGDDRLRGSGLIVVNPPWTLHDELGVLLPALAQALGAAAGGATRLDWLVPPVAEK
jgi:23S rRNA (adenine2030-N6)-methyltransferase